MRRHLTNGSTLFVPVALVAMIALAFTGCEDESGGGGFVPPGGTEGGAATGGETGEEGGLAVFPVTDKFQQIILQSCSCLPIWGQQREEEFERQGAEPPTIEECQEIATAQLSKQFYIAEPDCIANLMTVNAEVKAVFDCVEASLDETIACIEAAECVDPATVQACKKLEQAKECLPEDATKEVLAEECNFTGGLPAEDVFNCGDEGNMIIKDFKVCDGYENCPNGADEEGCGVSGFPCADGSGEVSQGVLCNGEDDCADGSDEAAELCGE